MSHPSEKASRAGAAGLFAQLGPTIPMAAYPFLQPVLLWNPWILVAVAADVWGRLAKMRAAVAAAKAAKVGIAFVVSPGAGLREAGVAIVDTLVKDDPDMKAALNQVTAELTGLAESRGYSYEQSKAAFRSMQDLLEFHKLSVDELAVLGFDPVRATDAQLAKGSSLMRMLSQDESALTKQAVLSLYSAVLSKPKLLPGRDEAFQRRLLSEAKAEREADAERRAEAESILADLFARVPAAGSGPALTDKEAQALLDAETVAERRERARDQQ